MDEIIDRYNRALELLTPLVEARFKTYNHAVALAIIDSWRDIPELVRMIEQGGQ